MKLAAVVLLLVVVYAVAQALVPWPAVVAVPASIATVLAVVRLRLLLKRHKSYAVRVKPVRHAGRK